MREKETDVLKEYLTHYMCCDLISAGLSAGDYERVIDTAVPIMERWDLVEPFWNASRNTGYARSLDISARDLYGVDSIQRECIEELNQKFLKGLEPGHYRMVLKDKSRIRVSLLHDIPKENDRIVFDSNLECDRDFFRNVYPVDNLVFPQTGEDIETVERQFGAAIHGLGDWLEACECLLDNALKHGAVALKSALAYQRSLHYEKVTMHEAERGFNEIFKTNHRGVYMPRVFTVGKEFQDYVMHHILKLAGKRGLTIQFHTGIQEGNGNVLYHSDPSLLTNLFLEYPEVDFDLFHIGYPYENITAALAKNFPNVFIDMCWAHIISPAVSVRSLVEWIDSVPANKISAFGGDYLFVDGVYGHQYMARENVSRALAEKVQDGNMDVERAEEIARMIFYENPMKIFKLANSIGS
jgi:hypothetical protein